jgi:predicted small metal-binding protein
MNCTLTISGSEDEVVRAATEHAVSVHGHKDTPELREQIRKMLKDEKVENDLTGRKSGESGEGPLHLVV